MLICQCMFLCKSIHVRPETESLVRISVINTSNMSLVLFTHFFNNQSTINNHFILLEPSLVDKMSLTFLIVYNILMFLFLLSAKSSNHVSISIFLIMPNFTILIF